MAGQVGRSGGEGGRSTTDEASERGRRIETVRAATDGRWCRARLQCVCIGIVHEHGHPPTLESGTFETRPCLLPVPFTVLLSGSCSNTSHASARRFGMLPLLQPRHAGLMSSTSGPPIPQASLAVYIWLGAAVESYTADITCPVRLQPSRPLSWISMAEVAEDHANEWRRVSVRLFRRSSRASSLSNLQKQLRALRRPPHLVIR